MSDEESDELHRFCYLWIKEGMEKIGWTEEIPLSIIATCNSLHNKEGEIIIRTPLPFVDEPSETPNCNCHANNLFFICVVQTLPVMIRIVMELVMVVVSFGVRVVIGVVINII